MFQQANPMVEPYKILSAIDSYASAYATLQDLQENSTLIPEGDQKTGCIGEFYAYLYLYRKYPNADILYGNHSQKGWDIEISRSKNRYRVQVKTVSAYSKTRIISPIHHGWDELFLLYLDRSFKPRGFWIVTDTTIVAKGEVRKGLKCRDPEKPLTGSPSLPFGENRIAELENAISLAQVKT